MPSFSRRKENAHPWYAAICARRRKRRHRCSLLTRIHRLLNGISRSESSFQPSNLILRPVLTEYFAPFERHRKRERSHSLDALALRRDAQASFLPVQARGLDLSREAPAFAEPNEICECEACVRCKSLLDCNRQFCLQIFDNYSCKHLDTVFVNIWIAVILRGIKLRNSSLILKPLFSQSWIYFLFKVFFHRVTWK